MMVISHFPISTATAPLSHHQERLWFIDRFETANVYPHNPVYHNIPVFLHLRGRVDCDRLESCFERILERHAALRTRVLSESDDQFQSDDAKCRFSLHTEDVRGAAGNGAFGRALSRAIAYAKTPLVLARAPLLRAALYQMEDEEFLLGIVAHHIVVDRYSMQLILDELQELYDAESTGRKADLPVLAFQYADHTRWQRSLTKEHLEPLLFYWRWQLRGKLQALELPEDRSRPAVHTFSEGRVHFNFEKILAQRIRSCARTHGVTEEDVLLSGFKAVLHRYSGLDEIVVGNSRACRNQPGLGNVIGPIANLVVLRSNLSGNPDFKTLLHSVAKTARDAARYEGMPFDRLVQELNPEKDMSRTALFDVLFQYQQQETAAVRMGEITGRRIETNLGYGKYDIHLSITDEDGDISGVAVYNEDIYERATIEQLMRHYRVMLHAAADSSSARIDSVDLLDAAEKERELVTWNSAPANYPQEKTIHQLFEERAARTPDKTALIFGKTQLTYRELDRRANRLAHALRGFGVAPDTLVGVCLERSAENVVALLAVLKAGGAYLPIDPATPEERIRFMLEDAGIQHLISSASIAERIPVPIPHRLLVDSDRAQIAGFPATPLPRAAGPANLAYCIYTSGSTGKPKGALIEHRNVVRLVVNDRLQFSFSADDVWSMFHSQAFDFSVWEMYGALLHGGTLVVVSNEDAQEPSSFLRFLARDGVTVLNQTPSAFYNLTREALAVPNPGLSLRYVIFGGEALNPTRLRRWRDAFQNVHLINMYGITETTVHVTFKEIGDAEIANPASNIGIPIPTTTVYVMDSQLRLMPAGVPGELCVGGGGIGRGYLRRDELTQQKFVENPHRSGERLYRSGDLGKRLRNGELEYLGRIDDQVQIRGFRVELGEIQTRLLQHPDVQEAEVLAWQEDGESAKLTAYIVSSTDVSVSDLRGFLAKSLPGYMIPSVFVPLERLPLTSNGKIDRRALPDPRDAKLNLETAYTAPRTHAETHMVAIWEESLGRERIGIHDDFFELGGHSLLATQLISCVRDAFEIDVPLRYLFERPTVAALCEFVGSESSGTPSLSDDSLRPVPRNETLPLSFAQQRLWLLDRLEDGGSTYNVPAALKISGRLDAAVLERCLNEIVARHEVFRTSFPSVGGAPTQSIAAELQLTLPVVDLRNRPEGQRERELQERITDEATRPFELESGPLIRAVLIRQSEDIHTLLVNMHHIVSDGWSVGIVVRELGALYEAFQQGRSSPLPPQELQYADFAVWQHGWLRDGVLDMQLGYWREKMAGAPAILDLPTDYPRPLVQTFKGRHKQFQFSPELTRKLKDLSQQCGATLFMTLQASFAALLSRYSGQEEIVLGSGIANRQRRETDSIVGFFVNTLLLRIDLSGNPSFESLVQRAKQVALEAYDHQDIPFEKLVDELRPERNMGHTPLFQVLFTLQNLPPQELSLPGLSVEPLAIETGTAKFDLMVLLEERGETLKGVVEYSTDLFEASTIGRMLEHFQTLLEAAVADPCTRFAELPLLSEAEQKRTLHDWNQTDRSYPRDATIHELFENYTAETPDALAVDFELAGVESGQLTYAQLNARANQLARTLRSAGAGPGSLVAIMAERSVEAIIGMLGILKTGAGYVPLDTAYPKDRLAFMLEDSGATVLVTQNRLMDMLPNGSVRTVLLDTDWEAISKECDDDLPTEIGAEDLAYVIYTSGSTGEPKGVSVPHRAVNRLVRNTDYVQLSADERIAQASNTSFDAATFEIWGALLNGGTLVGFERDVTLSPHAFVERLLAKDITTLFLTTALFNQVAREIPNGFRSLRNLLFGGEAVDPRWVREVMENGPPQRLLHVYGPTENTTFSTWHPVREVPDDAQTVPIGRPIANSTVFVLDRNRQPVPVGIPGELYVGGDGLAQGYWNRPELTAESFVPDIRLDNDTPRLYRTGDIVRYRPSGELEFLGRADNQIKIRGFRIEIGEIESTLLSHPGVLESVVLYRDDKLVGYIVPARDGAATVQELTVFLQKALPAYMIPSAFVMMEVFPLNANGKIDRGKLPEPDSPVSEEDYAAPQTPTEEILSGIFERILGVDRAGVHDNFFDLGGHSLLATQVISRVRESFGVDMPLRILFQCPTVAQMAEQIDAHRCEGDVPSPPIEAVPHGENVPLSFAQERLWFLDQLEPGNPFYNVSIALRLEGSLNVRALEDSLREIVRRHETLRTTFLQTDGLPTQRIASEIQLPLRMLDLGSTPESGRPRETIRIVEEESRRPFDLANGPLLRILLLRLAEDEHVLQLSMHHIVSDGWSLRVFIEELAPLYAAQCRNETSPLTDLSIQYADFAAWQRKWLSGAVLGAQLDYWKERLAGTPPVLELPTDRPRPPVQSFQGSSVKFEIGAEVTAQLKSISRCADSTLFMTLLTAFAALLSRLSGQDDIVIGSPIANRTRSEIESLIGFFVNTLALRIDLFGDPTFEKLLGQVRRTSLDAYTHQDLPFEKLVDEIQPERDLSLNPLFQVMFALQNVPMDALELPDMKVGAVETKRTAALFDLVLDVWETGETLTGVLEFNADLFDESTMTRWIGHFQTLLSRIASQPESRLAEIPLLSPEEERHLLDVGAGPRIDYPTHRTIQDLFEEQAARYPHRTAAVHNGMQVNYADLNEKANRIAHGLRATGLQRNEFVGILDGRGIDVLASMLGVLKAGGAFVPVDPAYPPDRVRYMIENSGIQTLITRRSVLEAFDLSGSESRLRTVLDLDADDLSTEPGGNPEPINISTDRAYMLYTSGSTGMPKGAIIRHDGAVNHIFAEFDLLGFHADSAFLQSAPSSSDISVWQFLAPGLIGGRTVIADFETVCDPVRLFNTIKSERITLIELVPVVMNGLMETIRHLPPGERNLPDLEWAMATGEAVSAALVNQWLELYPEIKVVNAYGPTEAADDITQHVIERLLPPERRGVPIGRPLANLTLYVLDGNLQIVPYGVPGEICVSGIGVGEGYWRDEEKTKAAFLPNPYAAEGRGGVLYRTGDLGRWLPDGTLECLERLDHQVKIRGFRIELGEIEGVLGKHPTVRENAVVVREDRSGDKRLVGYVVPNQDASEVQERLQDLTGEQVDLWQSLHEDSYRDKLIRGDETFNTIGWDSNYTGDPLSEAEMHEYVDLTVERIRSLQPGRVLEIGCGTGLIMFPLLEHCREYCGIDLSQVAVAQLQELQRNDALRERFPGLSSATLMQKRADDFSGFEKHSFDTAVLSSVVQYFPGIDYLGNAIQNLLGVLKPDGSIFIGDVRSLPLLEAFHASVQLHKAPDRLTPAELKACVRQHLVQEQEMAVDPAFFVALQETFPQIATVEILPKHGTHQNEMTRFRYDVLIHLGEREPVKDVSWLDGREETLSVETIRNALANETTEALGVRCVPNARVWEERKALEWLNGDAPFDDVCAMKAELRSLNPVGFEPETLWEIGRDLSYRVDISFANAYLDGAFDVVFSRWGGDSERQSRLRLVDGFVARPWATYANDPLQEKVARRLAPELREFLKERIPNYMVPSEIVLLPDMPQTPAGKVDRDALPETDAVRSASDEEYVAPATHEETVLANIWEEVLGLECVGIQSNFFDLGGHSLKATQVVSRIQRDLGVEISLREIFNNPTVWELAANLGVGAESEYAAIETIPDAEHYPLSHGQRRLWVLAQMEGASAAYNMPGALLWEGEIDPQTLQRAFDALVQRHETLRTAFVLVDGGPRQRVCARSNTQIENIDLSRETSPEEQAQERARQDARTPFDLESGELVRVSLLKLGDRRYVLLFNMHHIISDDWSMGVLTREFVKNYESICAGRPKGEAPLPIQYRDYAAWQREFFESDAGARDRAYWHEKLAGEIPLLDLPTDLPRPPVKTYSGKCHSFSIGKQQTDAIHALGRRERISLFMFLAAAVKALLYRYTNQQDIVVGFPIAGRNHPDLEDQIGFYINTLPLRSEIDGAESFVEFLRQIRGTVTDALDHQTYPFDRLVDELKLSRDVSRSPMFDVAIVLQNTGNPELAIEGVSIRPFIDAYDFSKFDLSFTFEERASGLAVDVVYNTDLFVDARIQRMGRHLQCLVESVLENAERAIDVLPILPEDERREMLSELHPAAIDIPPKDALTGLFEAQAEADPERVALVFEETDDESTAVPDRRRFELSYDDLNAQANQLAHYLLSAGVGPDVLVGVYLERSLDTVVSILAILKVGGAYLPLDTAQPKERLALILEDARPQVLIAKSNSAANLLGNSVRIVDLDRDEAGISKQSTKNPEVGPRPDDRAYVIYTSGSTGRPKGVPVSHYNVVRLFQSAEPWFQFGPEDVWTLFHSYAFDFSVWEMWGALLYGGRLVVVPHWVSRSPGKFYELLDKERVTVLNQTPSAFRQLIHAEERAAPTRDICLRYVIFGGEALDIQSLRPWFERHGDRTPQLVNMYGITETTVHITYRPLTISDLSSAGSVIGVPLPDLRLYILDRNQQPVPVGVPGEICVGGGGVSGGYLNREDLTAEKFIPDPFGANANARLYRSGDLARYLEDGDIEYLGRIDDQVQIRGFRVELGEIQSVLAAHAAIQEAVVDVRECGGDTRVIAYCVAKQGETLDAAELRNFARERLPDYMTPSTFVPIERVPLTPNGKLDRKALPEPAAVQSAHQVGFVPPQGRLEETIAAVFCEILGAKQVGSFDNFFDLGGNSLTIIQAHDRLRDELARDIPVVAMFEHPSIHTLAAYLSQDTGTESQAVARRAQDRAAKQKEARARRTPRARKR